MHKQVSRSFSQALALRPESMATPPCHHGAAFTRFRPTLLAAALLAALWSAPTHAALNAVNYTVESDGTPGWDATDGPGLDTGPNNQRVRTHDEVTYQVAISYSGGTKDAKVELTLPKRGDGKPLAEWPATPPADCVAKGSRVSSDRQTLVCALPDYTGSGTNSGRFRAHVLGSNANGTPMPPPTLKVSSLNTPTIAPATLPPALTITAAPFYDVVVMDTYPGNPMAYGFQAGGGPNKEDGFYHRMMVGLMARNPSGNGKKGVEQLDPAKPIEISLNVAGYPQSVRLDNWRTRANTEAADLPSGSFADGCGSIWQGAPSQLAGRGINAYQRVGDIGGPSKENWMVANGGDCEALPTANGLPDNNIVRIRLTGVDTSLAHTPTQMRGGSSIPPDEHWVASKALVFWTNLNDYPPQQTIQHTLRLADIKATSISNQAAQNTRTSNDSFTYELINQADGYASKIYTPDAAQRPPIGTVRDPSYTGDDFVDYMAHGQIVRARVVFTNKGSVAFRNLSMCEIIDRTAFDLADHFGATFTPQSGEGAVQYGVRSGGRYFASTDSALSPRLSAASVTGASEYSRANCTDPSITWYRKWQDAEAAGGVTYVKGTGNLPGGKSAYLYISGLKLRETWAETITVQTPTPSVRQKGTEIAEGTIIRNRGTLAADNIPEALVQRFQPSLRDHLQVTKARTTTRITKKIIKPANATQPVASGTTLTFQLQPRYATVLPPYPGTVTVTDVLPRGMRYVPTSSRQGGQPVEPRVEEDTPTQGLTRLTWTYTNVTPHVGTDLEGGAYLPDITFRARLALTLPNGASLRNQAVVSGGAIDADPDCEFDTATGGFKACAKSADASVTIDTPPGFVLQKTVSKEEIEPGEPFHYDIAFYALGQTLRQIDIPDVIDILPFAGDGTADAARSFNGRNPASRFDAGAYHLQAVEPPTIDPGMRIYYTNRAPAEIHNDARDASNTLPGGSTRWCQANEFGSAGCPADIGQTTAIRTQSTLTRLGSGEPYEIRVKMTSDPLIAQPGDIFANHAGARPLNPSSHLLYTYSGTDLNVRIRTVPLNSLAGRLYIDGHQDGTFNHDDAALPNQCVLLQGQDAQGRAVTLSTRSNAQGEYGFAMGAANTVFASADCSGTALVRFAGVPGGTYTLSRVTANSADSLPGAAHAGEQGGQPATDGRSIASVTLSGNQNATGYDFTEARQKPRLSLQASVDNTHGGKAQLGEIALTAKGPGNPALTMQGASGSAPVTRTDVVPGTYALSSPALTGYAISAWQCVVNGQAPVDGASVALTWGDEATCSVRYAGRAEPQLTLVGQVTNNHGGKLGVHDVRLSAQHDKDTDPTLHGVTGEAAISQANVVPGTWTLSAPELPNYRHGDWRCDITTGHGAAAQTTTTTGATLALDYDQKATCTLAYEDLPRAKESRLTLVSVVNNRHGGTATAESVPLSASHYEAATSRTVAVSGNSGSSAVTQADVVTGDWTLSAPTLPQYWHSDWQCSIDGARAIRIANGAAKAGVASSLNLQKGQAAVCTIVYEDSAPARLTLVNTVTNVLSGTAQAEDFPLSADGRILVDGRSGQPAVTQVDVPAGAYTLAASTLPGYSVSTWSCTNASGQAVNLANSKLSLQSHDDVTCRVHHVDQPVSLTLALDITNSHGGTATPAQHAVSASGPDNIQGVTGSRPVTLAGVRPGVYELQALALPGYQTGKWVCNGGSLSGNTLTLASQQNVTCRLELKDIPASLKLAKAVEGSARLVAGTANEYDVAYTLTVSHEGGIAGVYDLVDAPAFDSDVEIVSTTILRNDQALNVTPSAVTGAGTGAGAGAAQARQQWPLATQQSLAIGASDVYRMTFRVRVPFEGSTANDRCQAAGDGSGHGLFNAATLTRQQGGQASGEPLSAQACLDTPEPVLAATLSIDKTSTSRSVEMGDLITYQLRIRNNGKSPALSPMVVDRLPRGFRFEPGSVRIANARATQVQMQGDRELHITLDRVAAAGTAQAAGQGASSSDVTITYRLRAGVGSSQGDGINRAHVQCLGRDGTSRNPCSNESRWKVRVTGGIFSDEACLAGQIYVDCNGNSVKDREELGIPGVRLYLENGTWIVSDEQGKYSHCGLRPRTHVLKVDERTLPRKSRLVTSSAQNVGDAHSLFIDAKKGMLHRADFIEGSCSATVIEQVKARQAQGANVSVQTEPGHPGLSFDSKRGIPARPRQQGTDGADQPMAKTRH